MHYWFFEIFIVEAIMVVFLKALGVCNYWEFVLIKQIMGEWRINLK